MEACGLELKATKANVNRAIQSRNKEKLVRIADQLKKHMNDLNDDIKSFKDNGRKVKRLEYDLEEILDNVDNLQIKLDAETSSPNPNQEKILKFTNEKKDLNEKHKKVEAKVKKMKKVSSSGIKDNETLEIKIEMLNEYGNLLQRIKDTLNEKNK